MVNISGFTDYQILVLLCMGGMNFVCASLVVFVCYALVRFQTFREGLSEAIQDGDKVFHWVDAKSFGFFVAGCLSAWFTMNLAFIFAYGKMFEVGPDIFLGIFVSVTFALWGIAWKK
jgi:hypothetical protein